MKRNWSIQTYNEGDEEEAVRLLKSVYGKWHDMNYWLWKYKNNPAGFFKSNIQIARDNDKMIGYFALVPVKMKLKSIQILGSLGVDLATHQDYQRQGVFVAMANKLYAEAAKNDIPITYAFPFYEEAAHKGHMKMGWLTPCIIPNMVKRLSIDKAIKNRIKNRLLQKVGLMIGRILLSKKLRIRKPPRTEGLTIEKITVFDGRVDKLWEKVSEDYNILVIRDSNYLNWRYAHHPDKKYTIFTAEKDSEILGFVVLGSEEFYPNKVGYIVDILTVNDKEITQHLLTKSLEYFRSNNVDAVTCWMLRHHWYYKMLKENGFTSTPSRIALVAQTLSSRVSKEVLADPQDWFITMGDDDGI